MPIKTPLNISPYFSAYNTANQYYHTLFKPSVAVQVRELNELQMQLQNQIEKFGDNIFKSGTIVSGCNFQFFPVYNFVKLQDNNTLGAAIDPSLYVGKFVKNSQELRAYVTNSRDGFESSDPDLKTVFVNYINSGNDGSTSFGSGDILTVYNGRDSIFSVKVDNGGQDFSNNDTLVFCSSIEVSPISGEFSIGDYVTDPVYGSNAEVIAVHEIDNSNNVVLDLKPRTADLTNASANSLMWTFGVQNDIEDSVSGANTAQVMKVHGTGAAGQIVTNGIGRILSIFLTDIGEGYEYAPFVTVKSDNNNTGLGTLDLEAINYYDKIKVATLANPVGNGYAFGVSEGVIYQVGHFLNVEKQVVVVNAYSSLPNNVTVGFHTQETVVDYTEDSSLLDNALGTENENAPGADRLKLTPVLVVANTTDVSTNTEFLSLVEWSDGNPYKQTQVSVYSKIGDEMAARMDDSAGNFVLDPFLVTTSSIANSTLEGTYYTAVIDPGEAYISGYKTKTLRNFKIDVPKGLDTKISNTNVTLNYDAYIRINEVGGLFQFSTGDTIKFYGTAKGFISNSTLSTTANTTPQGSLLGTARIRSMLLENGIAGDATAIYRLYLFGISMNSGANFRNVKSVYYDGVQKGIADIVVELDPTTSANIAVLHNSNNNTLVFPAGVESIRNTNNTTYVYRTIDQTSNTANTGILTKSIASNPNEFYPYSATLSDSDMRDLYVVPIANNLTSYAAASGTVTAATNSPNVVGSSTSFISDFKTGDYVKITNGSGSNNVKRVVRIVNNTQMVIDSNCSWAEAGLTYRRVFPKYVPIPFGTRSNLTANLNGTSNELKLYFWHANGQAMTMEGTTSVNTALGVSIRRTGVTSTPKTAIRNHYVKIRLANVGIGGTANTTGPWCLGVPDAFRLRNVYIHSAATVNVNSIDIGQEFFIDHNQNTNYLDLSYLHLDPKSSAALTSADYLLVKFDYYRRSDDGYFDTVSYTGTANAQEIAVLDSLPLANLTTKGASFEIPEMFSPTGARFDMINCLDFRPALANTVTTVSDPAGAVPVNPPYTVSFGDTADPANDKKFPLPDSTLTCQMEQYMGRLDVAIIGPDGNIVVQRGIASEDPTKRYAPAVSDENLTLNKIKVPPYPNITINLSNTVVDIIDTSVHNKGRVGARLAEHTIVPLTSNSQTSVPTQPKGFKMAQIGQLERRIQDLEYYTSLSILETSITNKIIPSSIDGSMNRFKFGFTADDFSTDLYSDTTNPQYAAEIETADNTIDTMLEKAPQLASNLCVPKKFRWSLKHDIRLELPFVDHVIVSQNVATTSLDPVQPACIPVVTTANVITQSNTLAFTHEKCSGNTMPIKTILSSLSGNATIYFQFLYDPKISVYQSHYANLYSAVHVANTASAVDLTTADRNYLWTNQETASFWAPTHVDVTMADGIYQNGLSPLQRLGDGWVAGAGKLNFTHNPNNGRYYFVRVDGIDGKRQGQGFWAYYAMMRYPTDQVKTSTVIDPCGQTGAPTGYTGTATAKYARNSAIVPDGTLEFDGVVIEAKGLLPGTRHYLYVNGVQDTVNVKPFGGVYGDPLKTDTMGRLTAVYNLSTTNWANREAELGLVKTPNTSTLVYNEGQTFDASFKSSAYQVFEILAPNSRAGANLAYVPWTGYGF